MCDVMILDDDHLILVTLAEALRDEGFEVEGVRSAGEVIARMGLPRPPRVLVIDIDEQHGRREIAAAASRARPVIRMVFTTVQPFSMAPELPATNAQLMGKPFRPSELATLMREMLAA